MWEVAAVSGCHLGMSLEVKEDVAVGLRFKAKKVV